MMNITLNQKLGTNRKQVTIMDSHLLVYNKTLKEELEYRIKFEELGFETVKKKNKAANIPFYMFLAFVALNLGLLIDSLLGNEPLAMAAFWFFGLSLFGGFAYYTYLQRNTDSIYLTGGSKVLELMAKKPDETTVQQFIKDIYSAKRSYYKNTYTQFDADVPFEVRVGRLKWLRSIDAITEEEYTEWVEKLRMDDLLGL